MASEDARGPLLIGEVFTAPGPRKRPTVEGHPDDPELGEDAGGVLLLNDAAWIWVADGASDTHTVSGLSSRRLAQELGQSFISHLLAGAGRGVPDPAALKPLLEQSIQQVVAAWTERLEQDTAGRAALTRGLKAWAKEAASATGGAVFYEFAATFAAAGLTPDGRLSGLSVGDSFLMVNPNGVTQFFALKKGSVTLRLSLEDDHPRLDSFVPEAEQFENRAVDLVTLSTDGTKDTLRALRDGLGKSFRLSPATYPRFRQLLQEATPQTQDDKTLAFAGRLYAG